MTIHGDRTDEAGDAATPAPPPSYLETQRYTGRIA